MNPTIKKTVIALSWIALGIALTVAALIGTVYYYANRAPLTEQAIRKKHVVELTKSEQERRGVDCLRLQAQLQTLLDQKLGPVFASRGLGQDWAPFVSKEVKSDVARLREHTFVCTLLYKEGDSGTLNDLRELSYVEEVGRHLSLIDIILTIGAPKNCDAPCLDRLFGEMNEARRKASERLRS